VPLAAIPLLREDSVTRGVVRVAFEMAETVEVLMNAVNVTVHAHLVPFSAFERFKSLDELNRSYEEVAGAAGQVVPFFETMAAPAHGANPILKYMGKHARPGTTINTAYIEAYNEIWNLRAKNRSPDITQRARLENTLAPAFWHHNAYEHIVPDFDQALMDGEVALSIAQLPAGLAAVKSTYPRSDAQGYVFPASNQSATGPTDGYWTHPGVVADVAAVFTEMANSGIRISLANIDMARQTQAFARLRLEYAGHNDEYIIDLLMNGIQVPEQDWLKPMLLGSRSTIFGMSKRYATDAGNLTESVVNGGTFVDLSFAVPRCPPGGVIMITAEVTPEQLFERQRDPFMHVLDPDILPAFLRDTLDPEKVSVVKNEYVDLDHATPDNTFGYAPLNYEWAHNGPQIGGRFYRPAVNAAFDEDRQRIWAVETANPVLSQDFYLCTVMHQKPFVVTTGDPFEALVRGQATIAGNTVFGPVLIEASAQHYDEVMADAPATRIVRT
jgi:hypothetical protein